MRIVFFRDGVSEGEYARIAQEEIERIRGRSSIASLHPLTDSPVECLENLVAFQPNGEPDSSGRKAYAPGAIPKVTFIVVGKRYAPSLVILLVPDSLATSSHHVRFFPVNR